MTIQSPIRQTSSRIRRKHHIEVELVLRDGTQMSGSVFLMKEERVQDLLNDPRPFFPLRLDTHEIILVNKSSVALCKPADIDSDT